MILTTFKTDQEKINICRYENGKYYINYNMVYVPAYGREVATCTAGGFSSYQDARAALLNHRTNAQEVTL